MNVDSSNKPAPLLPAVSTPAIEIRGHTYGDHRELIPSLQDNMSRCGCWLLDQQTVSPTTTALTFEIPLRSIFEMYGTLLSSGIQLSRDSHTCMKSLCTVRDHNPHRAMRRRILTVRLDLVFLKESASSPQLTRISMGHA
ncbi:MAG: hypothetical protein ACP5E5_05775 [Acidobacteriaceae bacterium]